MECGEGQIAERAPLRRGKWLALEMGCSGFIDAAFGMAGFASATRCDALLCEALMATALLVVALLSTLLAYCSIV